MSTLNRHIEEFFGEIGEALHSAPLDLLGIVDCHGAGEGIRRSIEMIRKSKEGHETGCIVRLGVVGGNVEIVVTMWTRTAPEADRTEETHITFPMSTLPEIIAGFMVSRFPPLP